MGFGGTTVEAWIPVTIRIPPFASLMAKAEWHEDDGGVDASRTRRRPNISRDLHRVRVSLVPGPSPPPSSSGRSTSAAKCEGSGDPCLGLATDTPKPVV